MWNDPPRLNYLSSAVFFGALLALFAALFHVLSWQPRFFVKHIMVKNHLNHLDGKSLVVALQPFLPANTIHSNLEAIRKAIATLPFVKRVEITRVFPDTLEIAIEEYHPVARWKNGGLIAEDGTVFSAQSTDPLPIILTEEALIEPSLETLKNMRSLFKLIGKDIATLIVTPRESVALRLTDGTGIIIGRDDVIFRAMRFVRLYPLWQQKLHLNGSEGKFRLFDLRYTHGFAIRDER